MNENPLWDKFKNYINCSNKKFNLEDVEKEVYGFPISVFNCDWVGDCHCFLSWVEKLKLIKNISNGYYIKLKQIPIELTSIKAREISNDTSWKSWFIPLEERIKEP